MTPRVSVVVPAYNNEAYIAETMRSVLAQTFVDFEVVVADHSSTDRTRNTCLSRSTDRSSAVSPPNCTWVASLFTSSA